MKKWTRYTWQRSKWGGIPALLRRFHEAIGQQAPEVVIWGSGTPMREFLHEDDMAAATVHVMNLDEAAYQAYTQAPLAGVINDIPRP